MTIKAERLTTRLSICALTFVIGFTPGCGRSGSCPEPNQEEPFHGLQLAVAVPAPGQFGPVWRPLLDEWSAQTGAGYSIEEYTEMLPLLQPARTKTLSNVISRASGTANASDPAILLFPITRTAELNAAGLLGAIPEGQSGLQWLDLLQGLREQIGTIERRPTVLPVACPVFVCYYRRDLLEAHGLQAPDTWQDYQKLVDECSSWGDGLPTMEPWGKAYRATMLLSRAVAYAKHPANYSLFFDIQTGEPLIDTPGFVRALQEARVALTKMPADVIRSSPQDCRRAVLSGEAALAICFETGSENLRLAFGPDKIETAAGAADGASTTANADEPATRIENARIGFCRLPGATQVYNQTIQSWEEVPGGGINRITLTAFAGLAAGVSSGVKDLQAEAAWNLISTLVVENTTAAFPGSSKSLCRESQLAIATSWVGSELPIGEAEQYVDAVAASLRDTRLVAELPVVGRHLFRRSLTESIGLALSNQMTAEEALAQTARQWREIIQQVGADVVRDSYRSCLGLRPAAKR